VRKQHVGLASPARLAKKALTTVLPTKPPGEAGAARTCCWAWSKFSPCQSLRHCWHTVSSIGSQPFKEPSPQPTAPLLSVTDKNHQLVFVETCSTWLSMRAMVVMLAV
jgi:hypothetical protein